MKKVIVIVAVVVVLGIAGAAFFILTGGDTDDGITPEVRVAHQIGEFTANVRSSRQLFRTNITVVANTEDEALTLLLIEESARIRHTIIFLLREMTQEDIEAQNAQVLLGQRIVTALNSELGIDNLVEVLFTEFVMA